MDDDDDDPAYLVRKELTQRLTQEWRDIIANHDEGRTNKQGPTLLELYQRDRGVYQENKKDDTQGRNNNNNNNNKQSLSGGVIVVIAVCTTVVVLLILAVVIYIFKRLQAKHSYEQWYVDARDIHDTKEVLGRGSFGVVTKGFLRGTPVALKHAKGWQTAAGTTGTSSTACLSENNNSTGEERLDDKNDVSSSGHRGNIIQGSSSLHSHNDTIMEGSTIGATLLTEPSMQSQSGFFYFFTKKKPKNSSAQESLRAELLLLVKLRHDHIVQTLGASQEVMNHDNSNSFKNSKQKSQLVLILQYMENGPIRNILKENNDAGLLAGGASAGMSLEVQWALQVAKGVAFLHAVPPPQGGPLVHADLKSSNVLLDANYNAHISDFGLATKTMSGLWSVIQARSSSSSSSSSKNKNPRGSILWMAPEVLNGADPTPASDVYSYSMFLVELMTRDRPYGVKAVMAMDHRNSSSMTTSDFDSSNNSKQQQLTTASKQESSMSEDIILDVTANTDEIEEESNDKQQVENAIASCSNNNKRRAVSPKRKLGSRVSWNPDATANTSKRSVTSTTTSTSNDFYAVINGESLNRTEIINRVKDLTLDPPFRPTLPDNAPQILVDICTECWHKNPKRRPTMAEVESRLAASSSITLTQQLMRRGMVFDSILPPDVQDQLAAGKTVQPKTYHGITVMFSDIVGFTSISSVMTAEETCDMIFRLFTKFEGLCKQYSVKKIDIVGDCFIGCAMEQQQSNGSNAEETNNACRAGRFALDAIRQAQQTFVCPSKPQLGYVSVRFGLASGSAVATVIGSKEHPKYTLYGDAVNTASRMESTSLPNRVQVTQTTAELIQNASSSEAAAASNGVGMKLVPRGTQEVKGKGAMKTFFLLEEDTTLTASELLQLQQQPVKRRRNSLL